MDGDFGVGEQIVEGGLHAVGALARRIGDVERLGAERIVLHRPDGADLFEIGVGQDRLAHFEPLARTVAVEVEDVGARADEADEAHHRFLADRVDRRVGDLGEVLLEIGVEQLALVGHGRDRRVGAHRARGFLAGGGHRRQDQLQIFLGVAEGLLQIEQRNVVLRRLRRHVGQVLEHDLGAGQPLPVGLRLGELGLDLLVGDDGALLQVDQQHLARLQPPLGDDLFRRDGQRAHLGRHDHLVVVGDDVAGRPEAVAVERGADEQAVGKAHGGRAVPRLHQGGVVFVEGAAVLVHQRVAGPGFRDEHHGGMRQRVAAARQEFERVVEAGGVRLAGIGNRPELLDVGAEQIGGDRGLARRHPVDVAADGVDLAIVADEAVGVGEPPAREGVGREALVHEGERRGEFGVAQIGIIGAQLGGEEHALVDQRAAAHRHDVEIVRLALEGRVDLARADLADDVELALERLVVGDAGAAADDHLAVAGFGGDDLGRLAERGIVGRHVAPAEHGLAFVLDDLFDHFFHLDPQVAILRHEDEGHGIGAGRRQGDALLGHLAHEEGVRNLHHDAGAVAHQRIGADGAAMLEVLEDVETVGDDLVRGDVLEVDDEADAAGIVLAHRVEQAERLGAGIFANGDVRGGRGSVPCLGHLQCSFVRGSSWVRRAGVPSFRHALRPGRTCIVRLRPIGAIIFIGERLCIQMAARSGSLPRPPVSAFDKRASRSGVRTVPGRPGAHVLRQ